MEEVSVSENRKKPIPKKYFCWAFGILATLIVVLTGSYHMGYPLLYLNMTESATKGVYVANPFGGYGYGDYVIVSSPGDFNLLKKGTLLLKQVRGLPGDIYVRAENRLEINGRLYPVKETERLPQIPKGVYRIAEDSYLLLNDMENSFDGRYIGPVEKKYFRQKVFLLFNREAFWEWEREVYNVLSEVFPFLKEYNKKENK